MTSPEPEPRRTREPAVPPTVQLIATMTLALSTFIGIVALFWVAVAKGVESAITQLSNLVVLLVGVLAGLVAGKHGKD